MRELVLVPGLLCTAKLFAHQVDGLADVAQVSIAEHTQHDTMAAIAASALSTAPEKFVLGGLSMGGYVALEMVRQAPDRIGGLILMDTNARADRDGQKIERQRAIDDAQQEGIDVVLDAFVPMMVHPSRLQDVDLIETIRVMGQTTGLEAFARQQTAIMARRDNRQFLGEIECPTLVIVGAEDRVTPVKVAQEMVDGIKRAQLEVVSNCGHLPPLERPDRVTGLMRAFLETINPPGKRLR